MAVASFAALDLRWRSGPGDPDSSETCELIHAQLDAFAHDLYAVLTTGAHVGDPAAVVPMKPVNTPQATPSLAKGA